ncbi:hypothetical protein P3551_22935 [Vibrio parahaemolyticus]|nr:hypothetical protein [Vibrio parahaemolyticus]
MSKCENGQCSNVAMHEVFEGNEPIGLCEKHYVEFTGKGSDSAASYEKGFVRFNDGAEIYLGDIELIGEVGGDPAWLRYKVVMNSGQCLFVHESRKCTECGINLMQMPREELSKRWKSFKGGVKVAPMTKYILRDGEMRETLYDGGGDDGELYYLASDIDSILGGLQ